MVKPRLLHAVCAVAMLAAAPVFAQTATGSQPGAAAGQSAPSGETTGGQPSYPHRLGRMQMRNDTSQNSAVDRLNDESYQAAEKGQAFNMSSAGAGGTMAPSGSESSGTMPGGSQPNPSKNTPPGGVK